MNATDTKSFHLRTLVALTCLSLLLSGCSIFGFNIVSKSRTEAKTQIGNIGKVIIQNERNNQTAIDSLIQLYAAQVEQTNTALWNKAKLEIKLQIRADSELKKKALITELQQNLDQKIDPILDSLQTKIKEEKAKIDNNQGGDINKLNQWGAQFSATLAKLVEEKQLIAEEVDQAFGNEVDKVITESLDTLKQPSFSLNTADLITTWKQETDNYISELEQSIESIQTFAELKSPIEYAVDGFLGNKSGADISSLIFTKLKTLATDKLSTIETDINAKIGTAVTTGISNLQTKYNNLLKSANGILEKATS